eukprot:scaffold329053_cov34-Prasinocladus_malaysianus.AAC.1
MADNLPGVRNSDCLQEIELIPDGANVTVTNANRLQYVALVADWHLNGGSRGTAAAAFARGLGQVFLLRWPPYLAIYVFTEQQNIAAGQILVELPIKRYIVREDAIPFHYVVLVPKGFVNFFRADNLTWLSAYYSSCPG